MAVAFLGADSFIAPAIEDVSARACALPRPVIRRVVRGYVDGRSEDVIVVPHRYNYLGSFDITSHSGPWDYLQRVPLVLYGRGQIASAGRVTSKATLADVYPTIGSLLDVKLEERAGETLVGSLNTFSGETPRLTLIVVWDGVGRNVLDRWPDSWPVLRELEESGTSYVRAIVGSSPSITPSTHSTLGTGTFPDRHLVSGIQFRHDADTIAKSFAGRDPSDLAVSTFADQVDRATGNASLVGMIGWRTWHLGMLGRGAALAGGDRDHLGIIGLRRGATGNASYYSTPRYLGDASGLARHLSATDASDGQRDGTWLGHPVTAEQDNPGWIGYQTDLLKTLMREEGYGKDDVPDILLTNFKATDIVGHRYSMDSPEMSSVLHAQDDALGELIDYLDRSVGRYVVVVTADHGHTPSPARSGAWPIDQRELESDLNAYFDVGPGDDLTQATTAVGVFLDPHAMEAHSVTEEAVARFLNDYTIGANQVGEVPLSYATRADEPIFAAAFPGSQLDEIARCARA